MKKYIPALLLTTNLYCATFTVTNTNTSGDGSLAAAILSANSSPGSTINFSSDLSGSTINVGDAGGLPLISASMTIDGGSNNITINGNGNRIFFIDSTNVTIQSLSLEEGIAQGGTGGTSQPDSQTGGGGGGGGLGAGGAVFVTDRGSATFTSVSFTDNQAIGGNGGEGGQNNGGKGGGGGGGGGGLIGSGGDAGTVATVNTFAGSGGGGGGGGPTNSTSSYDGVNGSNTQSDSLGGGGGSGGSGGGTGGAQPSGTAPLTGNDGTAGSSRSQGGGGGAGGSTEVGCSQPSCAGNGGNGANGATYAGGGGGGGGGGQNNSESRGVGRPGGVGGFGGGGGGAGTSNQGGARGGNGGFGAGGGGSGGDGGGTGGGPAAYKGGNGGNGNRTEPNGGGGGSGLGGAIFVQSGGSINIGGTVSISGNTTTAGSGVDNGTDGKTGGDDIFFMSSSTLTFGNTNDIAIQTALESDNTGTATLVKSGSGKLSLEGANTYVGTNIISGGILEIQDANSLGNSSNAVQLSGGTLQLGSGATLSSSRSYSLAENTTSTISADTGSSFTISSDISGAGNIAIGGAGTVVLSSTSNSYTGSTTFSSGTFTLSNDGVLGNGGAYNFAGGTLLLGADISNARDITLSSTGTLNTGGNTFTSSGQISGSGNLTITGNGTVALSGDSNQTGTITVSNGTVLLGSNTGLGTSANLGSGVTLTSSTTLSGVSTNIATNTALTVNNNSNDLTISGRLTGDAAIIFSGSGTTTLSNANSYSGGSTISAGRIAIGNNTALGTNTAAFANGTTLIADSDISNLANTVSTTTALAIDTSTNSLALTGQVTGSAAITKNGEGTLTLTGTTNDFSGGLNVNAGTVAINNNAALSSGAVAFENGSTFQALSDLSDVPNDFTTNSTMNIDPNGNAVTISGVIDGSGAITQSNDGTVVLSGNNEFTGGYNLNSGLLGIANNDALGSGTLVMASARTLRADSDLNGVGNNITISSSADINTNSNDLTLSGVISGTGNITKTSAGTLTLSGTNQFVGNVSISDGTLALSGSGSVPNNTGIILASTTGFDISGASGDKTIGDLSGSGTVNIGTNNLSFGGAGTKTFSGLFSGTGSVTKVGTGKESLTGDLDGSFNGEFFVNNGELNVNGSYQRPFTINGGGTLSGTGTLGTVTNNGTLSPGNSIGTINIAGNYIEASNSNLDIEIAPFNQSDLVQITGTAQLAGDLNIIVIKGTHLQGDEYTILTAAGGVNNTWSNTNLAALPFQAALEYLANSVKINVLSNALFLDKDINRFNPKQVSNYLEDNIFSETPLLVEYVLELDTLDSPSLTNALDRLHPAQLGAASVMQENMNSLLNTIFSRYPQKLICYNVGKGCSCRGNYSIWAHPYKQFFDLDFVQDLKPFISQNTGIAVGVDRCINDEYSVGIGGGYTYGDMYWKINGGDGHVNAFYLSVYGDYIKGNFSANASIRGGLDYFDETRKIVFHENDFKAKNTHTGLELDGYVGIDYNFITPAVTARPFADMSIFSLWERGFKETGANALNLTVDSKNFLNLRSEVGIDLYHPFKMMNGCFTPGFSVSGIAVKTLNGRDYYAKMDGLTDKFFVHTYKKTWFLISPGISASLDFNSRFSLTGKYVGQFGSSYFSNQFDLRLETKF